jgi:hypothetical protein
MTDWLPGDFAVVHSSALAGRLIHRLQSLSGGRADYEHAIIGVRCGLIVEAEPDGAVMVPMHYPPEAVCWSTGRLPGRPDGQSQPAIDPRQRDRIITAAARYVGTPYSFADYLAIAAHSWHLPLPGLGQRFVADSGHMICSQLVDQCYQDAALHLFDDGRWPGYVRPCDLADLIRAPVPE